MPDDFGCLDEEVMRRINKHHNDKLTKLFTKASFGAQNLNMQLKAPQIKNPEQYAGQTPSTIPSRPLRRPFAPPPPGRPSRTWVYTCQWCRSDTETSKCSQCGGPNHRVKSTKARMTIEELDTVLTLMSKEEVEIRTEEKISIGLPRPPSNGTPIKY